MPCEPVELIDHVCKVCSGRIARQGQTYVCSNCGATATGTPAKLCGCGITMGGVRTKLAGFRCGPNPAQGPTSPSLFTILLNGEPVPPALVR